MLTWQEKKLQSKWLEHRGLSYRDILVKPLLKEFLHGISDRKENSSDVRILDFGCGDGYFVNEILQELKQENGKLSLNLTGIDIVDRFLDLYKVNVSESNVLKLDLSEKLLTESEIQEVLSVTNGKFDALLSVFTMHNIIGLEVATVNLKKLLKRDSKLFSVVVDPNFANWLREGAKLENVVKSPHSDIAYEAEYPIVVNHAKRTFYVPYYHRTLDTYEKILSNFRIQFVKIKPNSPESKTKIDKLFRNTIYYPGIIHYPSSLAIVGRIRNE
jgi:SAM-dependent methyltransferase